MGARTLLDYTSTCSEAEVTPGRWTGGRRFTNICTNHVRNQAGGLGGGGAGRHDLTWPMLGEI